MLTVRDRSAHDSPAVSDIADTHGGPFTPPPCDEAVVIKCTTATMISLVLDVVNDAEILARAVPEIWAEAVPSIVRDTERSRLYGEPFRTP